MKYIQLFLSIPILLIPLSCSAEPNTTTKTETVTKLLKHYFPNVTKNIKPTFKSGDFNGDGKKDIVVLFTPKTKPVETKQIKVIMPWVYPSTKNLNEIKKSLIIFQKTNAAWISDKTKIFVLLDTNGVLETPSFELLTSNKTDKEYASHASMLPLKTNNDLIILPTEAGIDTYIYWDKDTYKLHEPDEIP